MSLASQPIHYSIEASLMAFIVQGIFRMLELVVLFIDRIVCQVNEHIANVCTV